MFKYRSYDGDHGSIGSRLRQDQTRRLSGDKIVHAFYFYFPEREVAMAFPPSLYQRVMETARLLFEGRRFSPSERTEIVFWILAHQNRTGDFLFPPSPEDEAAGLRLVSGELPRTRLLTRNALELETLRLLALLGSGELGVVQVLDTAERRFSGRCFASICTTGECTGASIAWLRYRAARGDSQELTRCGLEALGRERDTAGRWHKFPFYYSLLWLLELPAGMGKEELAYASPACRRLTTRLFPSDPVAVFRLGLLHRVLDIPLGQTA